MSSPKPRPESTPNPRRYFKIREAAAYIGGTEWFIRTLGWSKAIPFSKIGKSFVYDRDDLDVYMQNAKSAVA